MPEPVAAEGECSDGRSNQGQSPDLAAASDMQSRDSPGALNSGAGDIESPCQNESERKTQCDQDNAKLQHPFRGVKDRQDCADDLDQTGRNYGIGQRYAVNPSLFEFTKESAHWPLPYRTTVEARRSAPDGRQSVLISPRSKTISPPITVMRQRARRISASGIFMI